MRVVGIINDSPSLARAEKGGTGLEGGIVSGVPPEKPEHLCQFHCGPGWPVRHYYRGICLLWLCWGDSAGTGVLGPNQEKTAKRLKSRSTSQPPPRLPPYLSPSSRCHSNSRLFHYSSLCLFLSRACPNSSPSFVSCPLLLPLCLPFHCKDWTQCS